MIPEIAKNEPALVIAFAQAAMAVLVAFGVNLTPTQQGALAAFVAASMALIIYLRSQVTPTRKIVPPTPGPTP